MKKQKIKINTQIPGGNVIVQAINDNQITLKKDFRDTAGEWFYWMFQAEFLEPGIYEFIFEKGPALSTRGPAVSLDGGRSWSWLTTESFNVNNDSFIYNYKPDTPSVVIFCLSMNYLQANFEDFAKKHQSNSLFKLETLCNSLKGRKVELVNVGDKAPAKVKVLLTSRHHCCEMTASYVLEGMLEETMNIPELLEYVEFHSVPFVDKDGVEDGDQGKNRKPHDHARDYIEDSIYPETKAIRKIILDNKINIIIDIHCPWIHTGINELIYIVGSEFADNQKEIDKYAAWVEEKANGLIPFSVLDTVHFGTAWNTKENYCQGKSLGKWAASLPFVDMSVAFEIPYANIRDLTLDTDKYKLWGRIMCQGLWEYIKENKNYI